MKKKEINPFICQGYKSPEYFCDRVQETRELISAMQNGRNVTLISPRRLGKTGLIWNAFHHIRKESRNAICIYLDIFPTKNQSEFVRMLGTAVANEVLSKSKKIGKKMLDFISSLRPVMGVDQLTGLPNVTLNVDPTQSETTVKTIFQHLNECGAEVFIAIDEFQQITYYPEQGTEAMLRSHIQFTQNVHFVFSGSKQHLMSEMFISPKRPFYQSTDLMNLKPLDEDTYYQFANQFFEKKNGHLEEELFHELFHTFGGYTWYIQTILNRLYESGHSITKKEQLQQAILNVVESKAIQYENMVQFLTGNQFSLLQAIAREGIVEKPNQKDFLQKYDLPTASSVQTALEALLDKELVYRSMEGYIVYDRFLNLWLGRL